MLNNKTIYKKDVDNSEYFPVTVDTINETIDFGLYIQHEPVYSVEYGERGVLYALESLVYLDWYDMHIHKKISVEIFKAFGKKIPNYNSFTQSCNIKAAKTRAS